MNKLSREKRSQLVAVIVFILLIATGLYMGLIRLQLQKIKDLTAQEEKANQTLNQISETSKNSAKLESDLAVISKELDGREQDMASDDLFASAINTIRTFKLPYQVEIKQFNSKGISDMSLFPKFPYKEFTVSIVGSAHYHDLGKFVADFENRFRSSRIANLDVSPDVTKGPGEQEKLMFRMDIVCLVKPTGTHTDKKP